MTSLYIDILESSSGKRRGYLVIDLQIYRNSNDFFKLMYYVLMWENK